MLVANIITLLVILSISLVTVFYAGYKDSLPERIGASIIGVWAISRLVIYGETSPDMLMLQVGLVFRGIAVTVRAVYQGVAR